MEMVRDRAPDDDAKSNVVVIFELAQADGIEGDELLALWLRVLLDGVSFGNWPWNRAEWVERRWHKA